ncbi:MAG: hypothetical protein ACOYKZ_07350 [Chlamydiia bacterium]
MRRCVCAALAVAACVLTTACEQKGTKAPEHKGNMAKPMDKNMNMNEKPATTMQNEKPAMEQKH